jgi:hypothetical protein
MISSALVTVGFASDNGQKDLSSRLMNHDNCLLNRVSVVVREGIMSYRSMQGAELARVQQVDRHSLKIIYSGCFWGFFSLVGLATIEIPTWYT